MLPLPLSGELEHSGGVGGGGEDDGAGKVRAQRRRAGAFSRGRAAATAPSGLARAGPRRGRASCPHPVAGRRRGGGGGSGAAVAAAAAADAAAWSPGLGRPGAFQPPDPSPAGAFAYPGWAPRSQTVVAVEATTTEQPASAPVSEPGTWPARQSVRTGRQRDGAPPAASLERSRGGAGRAPRRGTCGVRARNGNRCRRHGWGRGRGEWVAGGKEAEGARLLRDAPSYEPARWLQRAAPGKFLPGSGWCWPLGRRGRRIEVLSVQPSSSGAPRSPALPHVGPPLLVSWWVGKRLDWLLLGFLSSPLPRRLVSWR